MRQAGQSKKIAKARLSFEELSITIVILNRAFAIFFDCPACRMVKLAFI
jgi:hypothetical protein